MVHLRARGIAVDVVEFRSDPWRVSPNSEPTVGNSLKQMAIIFSCVYCHWSSGFIVNDANARSFTEYFAALCKSLTGLY